MTFSDISALVLAISAHIQLFYFPLLESSRRCIVFAIVF